MNHNSGVHLAFFKRNIIPGANTITDIVSLLIQVIIKTRFCLFLRNINYIYRYYITPERNDV